MLRFLETTLLILGIVFILITLITLQRTELREVQSGESDLWCLLHTGWQKIEPENVVTLHSNGKWIFNNGSARSCEVVKK